MEREFVIGEAARESGVGIETIRYYERAGIIPAPRRSAGGQRRFSTKEVARLRFIRRSRDLGFGIADIRELMVLVAAAEPCCAGAEAIGRRHLEAIRARLVELRRLEAAMEELVAGCEGANPGLRAAAGPDGARGVRRLLRRAGTA